VSARQSFASIDRLVYVTPKPEVVARLIESHGLETAERRWHWLDRSTLSSMGRLGRALLGQSSGVKRPRSTTRLQEAVGIEAGYVLGSRAAGERAADMRPSSLTAIEHERGLVDMPRVDNAEKGRALSLKRAADRGEPGAAEAIQAARAFEKAVARVLELALALVPEQPATGRFCLPEPSPELAAALSGCERAAVERVFPGLAGPVPLKEPAPMTETAANVSPKRLAPTDDAQIRGDHAATPKASDLAVQWGVSEGTVYYHLRRLGLTRPHGKAKAPTPAQTNVVQFSPSHPVADGGPPTDSHAPDTSEAPVTSLPAVPRPGYPAFRGRLDVDGLALAVELARRTGLDPLDAISWVRADAASAAYSSRGA
jgi:hypothetical protein